MDFETGGSRAGAPTRVGGCGLWAELGVRSSRALIQPAPEERPKPNKGGRGSATQGAPLPKRGRGGWGLSSGCASGATVLKIDE